MAMAPEFKLSSFASVVVGARLSKSGNAMPQSGDLEGLSAPLAGRSSGIEIVIDTRAPVGSAAAQRRPATRMSSSWPGRCTCQRGGVGRLCKAP